MKMSMKTLARSLMLSSSLASPAFAADCSTEWEVTRREACEKYNADSHWNNSQSNRMIQEYNARLREEERREAERRAAEQRRLEQDPVYQARLREEAAARAAAEEEQAKQAEKEATRQWMERMDRAEADMRAHKQEMADRAVRLQRIRQRVNDRLEAERQRLFAPGAAPLTADDYDRLVTLSLPEWDLMRYWADEGLKQFPREFAFRHAVVQTIGCPGKTYAQISAGNRHAENCPLPGFPSEAFLKTGESSPRPLDRAVACGFRYLKLEGFGPTGSAGPYLEKTDAMKAPWLADEATLIQAARDCEKGLTAGVRAYPVLLKSIAGSERKLLDKPLSWDAYRRWLLVSAAPWNGLDLGNSAQVEEGIKRVEETYHQGSEKEWTYYRD